MVTSTVWPVVKKDSTCILKECALERQLKAVKSLLLITFTFPSEAWD